MVALTEIIAECTGKVRFSNERDKPPTINRPCYAETPYGLIFEYQLPIKRNENKKKVHLFSDQQQKPNVLRVHLKDPSKIQAIFFHLEY